MQKLSIFMLVASFLVSMEANAFKCPQEMNKNQYAGMSSRKFATMPNGMRATVIMQTFEPNNFPKEGMRNSKPAEERTVTVHEEEGEKSFKTFTCVYKSPDPNELGVETKELTVQFFPADYHPAEDD